MKKLILIPLISLLSYSCGYLFYKKIECRDFDEDILAWFPGEEGQELTFLDSNSKKIKFKILEKKVSHTTTYTSDTGCGCQDEVRMLLSNDLDSIWVIRTDSYIYENEPKTSGFLGSVIDGKRGGFYYSDFIEKGKQRIYKRDSLHDESHLKKVVYSKSIGIEEIELSNGLKWVLEDSSEKNTFLQSFEYIELECGM